MTSPAAALIAAVALLIPSGVLAQVDVVSHSLRLDLDLRGARIRGDQTIRVIATGPATEVAFTANALAVEGVSVNGLVAARRVEGGRLIVTLPRPLSAGDRASIGILYAGVPARGLIFGDGFAYTSYFTCDWMFCDQDAPGDAARFSLDLRTPNDASAVVAGRFSPAGARHRGVGREPRAAHLYGFAAGSLTSTDLPRRDGLSVVAPTGSSADVEALFADTAAMVAFFEEKAGVALPGGTHVQLLTPGPEAQEGDGFAVIGRPVLAPRLTDPSEDWAIAHELAHQWWGNAITCADWSEMWLNEGFAVFMTAAWKERRWGRAAYEREMEIARRRWAAAAEAGFDKPLAWAGEYPSLRIRRGVQYSKGALFLDALRTRLGDAAFWAGVRAYTVANMNRSVRSQDLKTAMERSSGVALDDLFAQWVWETPPG